MASEPLVTRDDFGDKIEVAADPFMTTASDGSISPGGAVLITFRSANRMARMRLSGERLDALRELLDRAAMPGQQEARAYPCCGHCRGGPCMPHHYPCADGCNAEAGHG